MPKQAQPFS